ncbi:DUF1642 domain-containing protein [Streptococcus uberis]|uniref:DUF1642 domain-containing protein n=1 Tax=Streptococcus uberis TaxID=1349 RepID=UPI003D3606AA
MKIEKLKQGQAVWVKGFVDRSVFGGCGGFIDFYNQDGNHCGHISRNNVREMKEEDVQIDQPKPVVPQFVADKYEGFKHDFENFLINLCWESRAFESVFNTSFGKWFKNSENAPIKTLINMHQFGYTVEKEKLYTVEIPTNSEAKLALVRREDKKIVITIVGGRWRGLDIFQLTEQEIRKDFDWAWQWKKEVAE